MRLFFRLPLDRINWLTSSFLIGTAGLTLTGLPLYLWFFGLDWFQVVLFFVMLSAIGFSVTLGYHRLFSHITFQASWPIRLFVLVFGAGAFENSVLMWASEHGAITSMWIMTRIPTVFRKVSSTRTSDGSFSSSITISHTTT